MILCSYVSYASEQGIKGIVKDSYSQPIPNVTIIVEGNSIGTSANADGEFKLNLTSGTYKITFQALAYKAVTKEVVVNTSFEEVEVVLLEQQFQLKEVAVSNGDEDPAYAIMRKAISLAPFHLNQVKKYTANVYLRGTLEILTIPWLFKGKAMVNDFPVKEGDVFVQETVNEIKFESPDKCEQRVISMQNNFPSGTDVPLPNMGDSFYQPTLGGLISPLSPKAFSFYRFVYEGFRSENGFNICKIRVEPRHKSTELYSGYIYIVEDCWALSSLDLTVENSYGTLCIKQISTPLVEDAWMPITYNFKGDASVMGLSGGFRFSGSVKYPFVELNTALIRPPLLKAFSTTDTAQAIPAKASYKSKQDEKNEKFFAEVAKKDKLSTRDMIRLAKISAQQAKVTKSDGKEDLELKDNRTLIVEKDAKLKDSAYWSTSRPIPLTLSEMKALKVDTAHIKAPLAKTDSSEKKDGPVKKILVGLAFGKEIQKGPHSSLTLGYGGLIDFQHLGYNTVDGAVLGQSVHAYWQPDSTHRFEFKPSVQFAFARKTVMWQMESSYSYAPLKRGRLQLNGGSVSTDFNQTNGIAPLLNGIYTLFLRQNYEKLVNCNYISVKNQFDLANGLVSSINLTYSRFETLSNNTDYSFFYKSTRDFTSNAPDNINYQNFGLSNSTSSVADMELTYTPHQFYRVNKGVKWVEYSNYPTFTLHYKGGFSNVFASQSNFSFLEGSIKQKINMVGSNFIDFSLMSGGFLSKKNLSFSNFKHFNTQNIPVSGGNLSNSFLLLDYYRYSSSNYFVEGHFQYSTRYLLLKMLPILNRQLWSESLYVNYLTNELIKNYCEIGYGLNDLFFIGNMGAFLGFQNGKYNSAGFRLSFNF